MSYFPTPSYTNTSFIDFIKFGNIYTGDMLGVLILVFVWSVIFISTKRVHGSIKALGSASMVAAISGMFLTYLDLVTVYASFFLFILVIASVFMSYYSEKNI